MAEPYAKVGRGGAGNFYSKKDVEDVTKTTEASDLESQSSNTPSTTASLARALSASQPPPEYQHTGRGGAGNWIAPSELSASGLSQLASPDATSTSSPASHDASPSTSSGASTSDAAIAISKRVLGGSKPTYRGGRGGAGNYVDLAEEERVRREGEEERRREAEERVVRDVEAGLARPERAYGGRGGAWEMGDMS